MNYEYIDSDGKMTAYLESLEQRGVRKLALDLEGEFNLHCYGEHLCLIQIFDGEMAALVDPFSVRVSLIKGLLENPDIAKIMYDCSGDRTLLYRKNGIDVKNIEDLFPAAELIELEKRNLGFVQQHFLGKEPKAKKRFQQYNWMKRPIDPAALDYALEDVIYLFDLQKALMAELEKSGRSEEYQKNNKEVQERTINMNPVPGVFKKNRFKKMPAQARTLFKSLFEAREVFAEELDMPPNSLLSNENLFRIAQQQMSLGDVRFPHRVRRDKRETILAALRRAAESAGS